MNHTQYKVTKLLRLKVQ